MAEGVCSGLISRRQKATIISKARGGAASIQLPEARARERVLKEFSGNLARALAHLTEQAPPVTRISIAAFWWRRYGWLLMNKRAAVMNRQSRRDRMGGIFKVVCNTKMTQRLASAAALAGMFVVLLAAAACSKARATAPPPAAPEVEVAQVEQRDVPIYNEWIGTLDGTMNAEIKSQVTGYLMS